MSCLESKSELECEVKFKAWMDFTHNIIDDARTIRIDVRQLSQFHVYLA